MVAPSYSLLSPLSSASCLWCTQSWLLASVPAQPALVQTEITNSQKEAVLGLLVQQKGNSVWTDLLKVQVVAYIGKSEGSCKFCIVMVRERAPLRPDWEVLQRDRIIQKDCGMGSSGMDPMKLAAASTKVPWSCCGASDVAMTGCNAFRALQKIKHYLGESFGPFCPVSALLGVIH